jgi:hypothetical protein
VKSASGQVSRSCPACDFAGYCPVYRYLSRTLMRNRAKISHLSRDNASEHMGSVVVVSKVRLSHKLKN